MLDNVKGKTERLTDAIKELIADGIIIADGTPRTVKVASGPVFDLYMLGRSSEGGPTERSSRGACSQIVCRPTLLQRMNPPRSPPLASKMVVLKTPFTYLKVFAQLNDELEGEPRNPGKSRVRRAGHPSGRVRRQSARMPHSRVRMPQDASVRFWHDGMANLPINSFFGERQG